MKTTTEEKAIDWVVSMTLDYKMGGLSKDAWLANMGYCVDNWDKLINSRRKDNEISNR